LCRKNLESPGGSGFLGQHIVKHLQLYATNLKEIRVLDIVPYEKKLGKKYLR
jgi:nucleoside-diphosphate-sugar epimerase